MSATDDALTPPRYPDRRPARRPAMMVIAVVGVGVVLGATLSSILAERHAPDGLPRYEVCVRWEGGPPAPAEWPRPARPGEEAAPADGAGPPLLVVRSFTVESTQALALGLQRRRLSGLDAASTARAAARARWRAAAPVPGTTDPLSPAAECAALLRGRLLLVALTDTNQARPAADSPTPRLERSLLSRAVIEVVRLALAGQADSLGQALTTLASAEGAWLQALAAQPATEPRVRLEAAWARHERVLAPVLEGVAGALEETLPPGERAQVPAAALERALALERMAPDPAALLFVSGAWGLAPGAVPVARTWLLVMAAGALAGALLGAGLALALPRRPRARRDEDEDDAERDAARARDSELAWLHVVCGKDPGRVARGAAALAFEARQRGERVLVLDAGRRLRLHERFGCDARWGLAECLAGDMPLLGAVQSAGQAGFYLLAHGDAGGAERWDAMSRLLEEARAHFGRVILALDPRVPSEAALPLGARVLEAWWAKTGPSLPRAAAALSTRLGIPFAVLDLDDFPQAMLEAPAPEPSGWEEFPEEGAEPAAAQPADEPAMVHAPADEVGCDALAARAVPLPGSAQPVPLLSDLEVRERLRFLIWMRRVQSEGRAAPLETGASG